MDVDSSDRNGKRPINHSQEDHKESNRKTSSLQKAKSVELPAHLRPKFTKKHKRKRSKSMSKESTKDEDAETVEKEANNEEDFGKTSVERVEEDEVVPPRREREREKEQSEVRESDKESPAPPPQPTARELEPVSGVLYNAQHCDRKKLPIEEPAFETEKETKKPEEDIWKETEKKRKDETKIKTKEGSGRTRKAMRKTRTPRPAAVRPKQPAQHQQPQQQQQQHQQQQMLSKRTKKKKKDPSLVNVNAQGALLPANLPMLPKGERSDKHQILDAQKRAAAKRAKTPDQNGKPKKSGKGFFRTILDKTKFWTSTRKSDCAVVATREFLARSYVLPEYDPANAHDFQPDPSHFLTAEQLYASRENAHAYGDGIFVSRRPYWLTRGNEDQLPKAKLHMINAMAHANMRSTPDGGVKRQYLDPKACKFKALIDLDALYGFEVLQGRPADEAKCVAQNTFAGTVHLQGYKSSKEAKKLLTELEAKLRRPAKDSKVSQEEKGEKHATFTHVPTLLYKYSRKDRPGASGNRTFISDLYTVGLAKKLSKRGHADLGTDNSGKK